MDDKTAKIPSLKEFEKTHRQQTGKKSTKKSKAQDKSRRSLKGDTHRVELKAGDSRSSRGFTADSVKTYTPRSRTPENTTGVSGNTKKLNNQRLREEAIRNFSDDNVRTYQRRQSPSNQGLTRTRVAGNRPEGYKAPQERAERRAFEEAPQRNRPPQPAAGRGVSRQNPAKRPSSSVPRDRKQVPDNRGQAPKRKAPEPLRHKKKKKPLSPFARKVKRIFFYSLIVLAVLLAGIVLSMTVLFKTENINVSVPDNFYSSQEIISASGLHYQDNIFTAGKNQAEERLMKKFPYIKSADIYAVMPDTINIDITLCTESYAVKTNAMTYIAGEDSKVLKVSSTEDEVKVPLVEGVEVKSAKVGEKLEFESQFVRDSLSEIFEFAKAKGYKKITALDIETNKNVTGATAIEIRYVYDNRIVVYLGIPENITYKMQTAHTIIDEKLDVNGAVLTGELDVSQCYDSNRSYFNQYSLIPDVVVTEPESSGATEPTTQEVYEGDEYYEDPGYYEDPEYYEDAEAYEEPQYNDYEESYE